MQPVLTVEAVTKQYSTVTAVDKLGFEVRPGEIFALLGPNGAGKTTCVRMLVNIIQPDSGAIQYALAGRSNISRPRDVGPFIGYLPEERGLYGNMKLLQSLVYFGSLRGLSPKEATHRAESWLERFELLDRKDEKASALSKGNQQKVQFIAAVMHEPAFAILDEPFSGLDPVNQSRFLDILNELRANGMTILLSAHQMNLVERIADRILLMNRGRRVLYGTLDEIRAAAGAQDKLLLRSSRPEGAEVLERHPDVAAVDLDGNGSVAVILRSRDRLPELLSIVAESLQPSDIRLETLDLHDLYVSAVSDDPRQATALNTPEGER